MIRNSRGLLPLWHGPQHMDDDHHICQHSAALGPVLQSASKQVICDRCSMWLKA